MLLLKKTLGREGGCCLPMESSLTHTLSLCVCLCGVVVDQNNERSAVMEEITLCIASNEEVVSTETSS
jgi:hypothetical protein